MEERTVVIDVGEGARLPADAVVPSGAAGVVVFAHGGGSGRRSPRNRAVAARLQQAGLATLLADLLTLEEEREDALTGRLRFDTGLLATRLSALARWTRDDDALTYLPLGYFGASTGAAAALIAAAAEPQDVSAVVCRGGRPDLARNHLARVQAPVLLIVGGDDHVVLDLNRRALGFLGPESMLQMVPGAGHLFDEPGALDVVAEQATRFFVSRLTGMGSVTAS
jgi:dienelactone hydrolase